MPHLPTGNPGGGLTIIIQIFKDKETGCGWITFTRMEMLNRRNMKLLGSLASIFKMSLGPYVSRASDKSVHLIEVGGNKSDLNV